MDGWSSRPFTPLSECADDIVSAIFPHLFILFFSWWGTSLTAGKRCCCSLVFYIQWQEKVPDSLKKKKKKEGGIEKENLFSIEMTKVFSCCSLGCELLLAYETQSINRFTICAPSLMILLYTRVKQCWDSCRSRKRKARKDLYSYWHISSTFFSWYIFYICLQEEKKSNHFNIGAKEKPM